ncbi:Bifunctional protein HldE [Candidatus Desulfarcum epimagneticum]|uniref:Bifunctional protein HldE n=1 Tax=uncultured Desulfobacteraceae bacterium TaxID=218296 RepID=A0A484HJX1_9BACT|nr:Bifunctional protein HldE [uncultured Desulfobacteraceae bacterium]
MHNNKKIVSFEDLTAICDKLKADGKKKVVLCHGCFDLLHIGHIRYFKQAKQMGDILVVTLSPDCFVDKGPGRPKFTDNLRAEAISSLDSVDFVAINQWETAEETLRILQPHVYVKGSDFKNVEADSTGKLALEEKVCKEIGAELAFTRDIVFSSTNLINRFFSSFPEEVQSYLNVFRKRYSIDDVLNFIHRMSELKVFVIGDSILDEYRYCHSLGASSKDPLLAVQYDSHDMFAGGVLAVANHAGNFAKSVRLATVIGEKDSHESFIRDHLSSGVKPHFFIQENAPTLIKRRYVDGYSMTKLLEIYVMDDSGLSREKDLELCEFLKETIPDYDIVISADFGHGAISENVRETLIEHAPFLAVNTQANAGNKRMHTISSYKRADYASIAEPELRLDARNLKTDIRPLTIDACRRLGCKQFVVTCGKRGSCVATLDGSFVLIPAFASKVVDRVGSGDAFFAISALAAYLNASPEMTGFIGNLVGSLAVEIIGNQKSVQKDSLEKYITSILK